MKIDKNSKVAYWCKTEELAKQFLKECDEQNIIWADGTKTIDKTEWAEFYDRTCYDIENNTLYYDEKKFYSDNKYTIIEYKGKEEKSVPNSTKSNELSTIEQITAREIIEILKAAKGVVKVHFEAYDELIDNIATKYGVEVEE